MHLRVPFSKFSRGGSTDPHCVAPYLPLTLLKNAKGGAVNNGQRRLEQTLTSAYIFSKTALDGEKFEEN
jgi:hypothetical protein